MVPSQSQNPFQDLLYTKQPTLLLFQPCRERYNQVQLLVTPPHHVHIEQE